MITESSTWRDVETTLVAFVRDFAEAIRLAGSLVQPFQRWRTSAPGKYVFEPQPERLARHEGPGSAFHLPTFAALRNAARSSPLGPLLNKPVGPRSATYYVNLEDFAFRSASESIRLELDGSMTIDTSVALDRLRTLRHFVESDTVDIEVVVLLRRFWARGSLLLDDATELRSLTDDEMLRVIQLGLIAPRFRAAGFGQPAAAEVELRDIDRVALVHTIPQSNMGGRDDAPEYLDVGAIVDEDIGRLSDAIAILNGTSFGVAGWRSRTAGAMFEAGATAYQQTDPLPRPVYITEPAFDLDANRVDLARVWTQLRAAEEERDGGTLRLATRRIGFAVSRRNHEDRLLDATIALEAMLVRDETTGRDIVGRLAPRAASVWMEIDGISAKAASKMIRKAYNVRRSVAHGDPVAAADVASAAVDVLIVARRLAALLLDRRDRLGTYAVDWDAERESFKLRSSP